MPSDYNENNRELNENNQLDNNRNENVYANANAATEMRAETYNKLSI
jgi:hypothetical protein